MFSGYYRLFAMLFSMQGSGIAKHKPRTKRHGTKLTEKKMYLFSAPTTTATKSTGTITSTRATVHGFSLSYNFSNNNENSKVYFKLPTQVPTIPCSSKQPSSVLDQRPGSLESSITAQLCIESNTQLEKNVTEAVLVVRRPALDVSDEVGSPEDETKSSSAIIDAGLEKFAKKMPIFEPERVESGLCQEKQPLMVNLDLALYKAKLLARNYRYQEAEEILKKCISCWPEDGRSYVALGKILKKQSKFSEGRAVYEKGCQATQGENAYIWQCWAVLENKMGNIRKARELFDAATFADKRHIAAWHGWAVLELKQGNVKKARQLLAKGLRSCGGNEYVYQTLALLEVRAKRYDQARQLFRQATKCNPRSCASWLAWAQMEMQQENNVAASRLFEKAVEASPKNRFAWHVWAIFEANVNNIEKARKLLKIGHALNPRDPVLLQSLALLEYNHSTANYARRLFRKASELDPRHQPVWIAWGWMEWKEGNITTARELYQKALSIDSTTESAARCLQAWGVLEQRVGNLSLARRLFRSSLNVNSQSYITWMTWAKLEEDQGNSVRAEEIRNLYFQQRTEIVDDASWVAGFLDIFDPALDSIKRLLNLENEPFREREFIRNVWGAHKDSIGEKSVDHSSNENEGNVSHSRSEFELDSFIKERLSLDPAKLDVQLEKNSTPAPGKVKSARGSSK